MDLQLNDTSASQGWNMSNSQFRDLGNITSNVTINGLTFIGSPANPMSVTTASVTVGGVQYSHALSLGGSGSVSSRAVSIRTTVGSTLRIAARSNGNETRRLLVTNIHGHVLGTINCTTTAAAHTITFTGDQTIYIYSAHSNILIYEIQLDTRSVFSSTKSWNMKNNEFKNLGTISAPMTINGLQFNATRDKAMRVDTTSAVVDGIEYTHALHLEGSGNQTHRSVALNITGTSTLKITGRSTGTVTRRLRIEGKSGIVYGTLGFSPTASLQSLRVQTDDTVYMYSEDSNICIYKVQLDTTGVVPGETGGGDGDIDVSNGTVVTTYAELLAAARTLANSGGIIYVNARRLSGTERLNLNSTAGNSISIIGLRQSDGTYPVIDYTTFRNEKVGSTGGSLVASGDDGVGFRITGSHYTVKNLIIEKAPDNAIQIKGTGANHNTVENCILRYNNDTGLQISGGASHNRIRFVYSYRNCDVYTRGGNADGFAPKLEARTGNTFYGCYCWENSDDGWDSFDNNTQEATRDILYEQCACWSNGFPDIFTGKKDYDNRKPLDKNLFLVDLFIRQNSAFETNYNNRNFTLPSGNFLRTDVGTISASNWVSQFDGNSNGFKLGSVHSEPALTRDLRNCLAFDHGDKGFDNNNGRCTTSFQNTVAFDNRRNYYIPVLTISRWSNVQGFSGSSANGVPENFSVSTPNSTTQTAIRQNVTSTVTQIENQCYANVIPGEVFFNIY